MIDSIVWHELGNLIEVIYTDWRAEHRRGNQGDATEMAHGAGLHVVPASNGIVRWVRTPGPQPLPPDFGRL